MDEPALHRAIQAAGFMVVPIDTSQPAAVSLRDWFAGMWIAGVGSHHNTPDINDDEKARRIAAIAYRVADAMLHARIPADRALARAAAARRK
ncbi:MAG: hypothetical protein HRU75_08030 [Planctomycetia bacterium]|nr:MAG: hypothetical protein HRU75_08030 [Planctomycetia bacterium]